MPAHRKYIELEDRTCPECGKIYKAHPVRLRHGRQTTCSRACSYAMRINRFKVERVTLVCIICSKSYTRLPNRAVRPKWTSACSLKCKGVAQTRGIIEHNPKVYKRGPLHALWDGGTRHRHYGRGWKAARKAARLRDKDTCQSCGKTAAEFGRHMQVHHVVPFRDFVDSREANKLENLICYCSKCHAQIDADIRTARRKGANGR